MKPYLSLAIIILLGLMLGGLGFSIFSQNFIPLEPVNWSSEARWISSPNPSYRVYARQSFYLTKPIEASWLRISADNDFILYLNGRIIAQEQSVLNNTLGLGQELSEPSQKFNDSLSYGAATGPHSGIESPRDWKVPSYFDLSAYLQEGKNILAIEVQKNNPNPRFVVEGVVRTVGGSLISLTTGVSNWRVATLSENQQQLRWFDPMFEDYDWEQAKEIGNVWETTFSRLSPNLYDRPLSGKWITGLETERGEVWLRDHWDITNFSRRRAFMRFTGKGNYNYSVLINGILLGVYSDGNVQKLHLFEVTNLLRSGKNTIAVRLTRPFPNMKTTEQVNPPQFFLDGWLETSNGKIEHPTIATQEQWRTLTQAWEGWYEGKGVDQPISVLGIPTTQEFQRLYEGDATSRNYPRYLLRQGFWQLGGVGVAFSLSLLVGQFFRGFESYFWQKVWKGSHLLIPGTFFLLGITFLQHRYAEAEKGFFFVRPYSMTVILLGFITIVLLSISILDGKTIPRQRLISKTLILGTEYVLLGIVCFLVYAIVQPDSLTSLLAWILFVVVICATAYFLSTGANLNLQKNKWYRWLRRLCHRPLIKWVCLSLIVAIGFWLRFHNLDVDSLAIDSDENTSYDAIRGIINTGIPQSSSGIWYTRSPAYHYMVALWLRLVGESLFNARLLSVLWGTATIVITYFFVHNLLKRNDLALLSSGIIATDPWLVFGSKFIRFYPTLQFGVILTFWLFIKGFVESKNRKYQYLFFVVLTLTLLTQEVTVTILPCFMIGFLFFYKDFQHSQDWPIPFAAVMTMGILMFDILLFDLKCLTPLVALSTNTDSVIRPHLFNITKFTSTFFMGMNRGHLLYSLFFFCGLIHFIRLKNSKLVFLLSSILINLLFLTLLVRQIKSRYFYSVYPIFLILAIYSGVVIVEYYGDKWEKNLAYFLPLKKVGLIFLALLITFNLETNRMLASYGQAIARQNTQVFEYIKDHRQPGDIVIASIPAEAAVTLGGLDYFVPPATIPMDGVYFRDGRLIDRWGGGVIINSKDQLMAILDDAERVWIHLDGYSSPINISQFVSAEHPREYLETLGSPIFEPFGVKLRLWKKSDGLLPNVPNQGMDIGNY